MTTPARNVSAVSAATSLRPHRRQPKRKKSYDYDPTTRYIGDIIELHRSLRYRGLVEHVRTLPAAYCVSGRNGLTTIGVRTADLPYRYLLGISGFRLAQYLSLGWASPAIVARRALFREPMHAASPEDLHFVTLDEETGEILGYLALVGSLDPRSVSVREGVTRRTFPVEEAHGLDLFAAVDANPDLRTHEVFEIKRFVHAHWLGDARRRLLITLELILATTRTLEESSPGIRALVGDAEARVALRHLLMMGLDITCVTGTAPGLAEGNLLHPAYAARHVVEPFYAEIPDRETVGEVGDRVQQVLDHPEPTQAVRGLIRSLRGSISRVPRPRSTHEELAAVEGL